MTEDDFLADLLPWLDGELAPDEAARMDAFAAANPDAAERAQAERALEERVSAALRSDVEAGAGRSFDALLAAAKEQAAQEQVSVDRDGPSVPAAAEAPPPAATPPVATPPVATPPVAQQSPLVAPQGRLLRLFRPLVGVAAACMMAVSLSWFYCIGPFECGYVEAVEAAAQSEATVSPEQVVAELRASLATLPELAGARRVSEPAFVQLPYVDVVAKRRRYEADGHEVTVLASSLADVRPSFRRHRSEGGEDWWVAQEGGQNVVAYQRGCTSCMVFLISDASEAALMDLARELRLADQ